MWPHESRGTAVGKFGCSHGKVGLWQEERGIAAGQKGDCSFVKIGGLILSDPRDHIKRALKGTEKGYEPQKYIF